MAIPRNVNGVNPAKVKKNGAYMSEHQDAFLQSEQELQLPGNNESLPDFDDAFQIDEVRPEKAGIFDEVKNLDESELDKLLGIDGFEDEEQYLDSESEERLSDDEADTITDEISDTSVELPESDDILPEFSFEEMNSTDDANDSVSIDEEDVEPEDDIIFDEAEQNEDDEPEFDQLMSEMNSYFDNDSEDDENEESPENNPASEPEDDTILFDEDDDVPDLIFDENDEDDNEDIFPIIEFDDEEDDEETFVFEEIDEENDDEDDAFSDESSLDEEMPAVRSLSKKKKPDNKESSPVIPEQKSDKPKEDKKKNSDFFRDLMQRLSLMKQQILADIKGDEIPQSIAQKPDEAEIEDEEPDSEEQEKKPSKKKNANKKGNPFKKLSQLKVFSPFVKIYQMLIKLCFGILNTILGLLSKLPFIGKLFKPLLSASKTLQKIATAMPIVILILILIVINMFSIPRSYESQDLPDGAAVTISGFSYDGETATATVENTGDTILDQISIDFTVYSMQPTLNPKTWIIPQAATTCSSEPMSIDIEGETEISVSCPSGVGKLPRVAAELTQ